MLESLVGLLASVDGRRIGRAVDGIAQEYYRVQVVKVEEEHGLITAYVLAFKDGQFTAEYCVTLGADGYAWCNCRDFIVGGHRCKHMAVLSLWLMREDALRAAEV
ncbi:MAG TPA: hypothetical protein GXX19_13330 [Syntrophomonadaceae bacterium]|nr:hypothetical protein [Syntrophomonadaceae bacterium]